MQMPVAWWELPTAYYKTWTRRAFCAESFLPYLPLSGRELDALAEVSKNTYKHDRTTTVTLVEIASVDVVLKRYNPKSLWHRVNRVLRKTRARRCWQMSRVFARAGLNVAQPIMMYERRFGPFRGSAYFLSHHLEGEELLTLLPTLVAEQREPIVAAMRNAFDAMAAANLSHGDLKASNLLWVDEGLFFVDLDAAQHHSSEVSWRRAFEKDKVRFMRNWEHHPEILAEFNQLLDI